MMLGLGDGRLETSVEGGQIGNRNESLEVQDPLSHIFV